MNWTIPSLRFGSMVTAMIRLNHVESIPADDSVPPGRLPGRRWRPMSTAALTAAVAATLLLAPPATNAGAGAEAGPATDIAFGRDILPILAENCLACHGPDEEDRHAGLRLDTFEGATELIHGRAAIVPGDPAASTLMERIVSTDPDEVMPPPKSHKPPLEEHEVALLREWIEAGAPWGRHWSFEPPVALDLPGDDTQRHLIDAWIDQRLEREGLSPAAPAAPHTRVRRLAFALTGLPPSPEDIEHFTNNPDKETWIELVRRYLDSPHYGERMAMWWMDLARYADTDGFQGDENRTNWPWRDWVIEAFNDNMPFDEFTLLQFAGDLLPEPTPEHILATAFHRHHMTNGEGGRDPEESRTDYVIDRVNTIGSTWLGLTLACAQCHTHKYDPVSHAEYFSLAAFFDSIDEDGRAGRNARPYHSYQSPHVGRALEEAEQLVADLQPVVNQARQEAEPAFEEWLHDQFEATREGHQVWHRFGDRARSAEGTELAATGDDGRTWRADGPDPRQDDYTISGAVDPALKRVTGFRLRVLPAEPGQLEGHDHGDDHGGLARGATGWFTLTNVKASVRTANDPVANELSLAHAVADFEDDAQGRNYGRVRDTLDDDPRNGWTTTGAAPGEERLAQFALARPWTPADGEELVIELRHRSTAGDANIARFEIELMGEPGQAARSLDETPMQRLAGSATGAPGEIDSELRRDLFNQFLEDHEPFQVQQRRLGRARAQVNEIKNSAEVDVMVLAEREEPRTTHVLLRGEWDQKGDPVEPGVIEGLASWPEGEPHNRIGLARWITSPDHPLTARVLVNHLWIQLFGQGLVRTGDDFGLLGEHPSHPELLDQLALELIDSGWDIKAMIELMVTSETWQRDSAVGEDLLRLDPHNRLLARGPRFRLPSWMLRDAALHHAGLLNPAIGGPPVRPYQPEGVWEDLFMGRFTYVPSEGPAQYRRTLYAFWRRSIGPTFLFDAAQRRVCEVAPPRTNTPLQALVMMNDETWLEAARALADLSLTESTNGAADPLAFVFRRVLGRAPEPGEREVLEREHRAALDHWSANPDQAITFTAVGQRPPAGDPVATAAAMLIASLVLNLDEAIHHE